MSSAVTSSSCQMRENRGVSSSSDSGINAQPAPSDTCLKVKEVRVISPITKNDLDYRKSHTNRVTRTIPQGTTFKVSDFIYEVYREGIPKGTRIQLVIENDLPREATVDSYETQWNEDHMETTFLRFQGNKGAYVSYKSGKGGWLHVPNKKGIAQASLSESSSSAGAPAEQAAPKT